MLHSSSHLPDRRAFLRTAGCGFGALALAAMLRDEGLLAEALEADEKLDEDHHDDLAKAKFTLTECVGSLVVSIGLVTLIAIFLVQEIEHIVARGVPDNFMGLILVPLVEKAAEHLTAVDEAWDNQIVSTLPPWRVEGKLTVKLEFRAISLPWAVHTNSTLQWASGRYRRLGSRKANGSQLRDLHGCAAHYVYLGGREILTGRIVQLPGRDTTGGKYIC